MGTPPSTSNPARDRLVHVSTYAGDTMEVAAIQVDLDAAKLWNLSASDLSVTQRSLTELNG